MEALGWAPQPDLAAIPVPVDRGVKRPHEHHGEHGRVQRAIGTPGQESCAGQRSEAREIALTNSELKFINDTGNPHYKLVISNGNMRATNLSNHLSEGPAKFQFDGKLMGSGNATLSGVLRPEHQGPNFDFDLAMDLIVPTGLPARRSGFPCRCRS